MIPHLSHVMTLANGIIGVSVLAMPFCFKQCGIVLATLVLLLSSVLSRLACHFLIKSAVMSRRRNFEFLAFHAFGRSGKFIVELFIIGFLLGTCVAFFVVVGDLGPQIVGKMLNKNPEDIRTSLLATTGAFIVFPLGLLRNIDSLSSVCTATIGFYFCLVVKVIAESTRHIFLGDWYSRVMYWRPGGILRCLPIFAMALFCQTQLFEIYEAIPNVCLDKMNEVVRGALNICTAVYLCVGFFGYVAFCTQPFTGNILMSFEPSLTSDLIKMGFVFSVAFSFPLVIFPCRASLNSLLFRRAHTHEPSNYYIPEMRFRCLTLTIVAMSLGTGILMPNIEFVLGIVGSTIGVMICLIFPAAFFIAISTKNTNERLVAQAIIVFGMSIMILGTYANLYAMEDPASARVSPTSDEPVARINDILTFDKMLPNEEFPLDRDAKILQNFEGKVDDAEREVPKKSDENADVRREPPIPIERSVLTEAPAEAEKIRSDSAAATIRPIAKEISSLVDVVKDSVARPIEADEARKAKADDPPKIENLIDSDAIKKEESELAAAGDQADIEAAARLEKFSQTLEKHKLEQLEMMQEQKEILKDIKEMEDKQRGEQKLNSIKIDPLVPIEKEKASSKENPAKEIVPKVNEETIVREAEKILPSEEKSTKKADSSGAKEESPVKAPPGDSRPKESHGPILNALTNRTSKRNKSVETSNAKRSIELPIALKMGNQTIVDEMLFSNDSFKVEDAKVRGEILGESGDKVEKRDKRDVDGARTNYGDSQGKTALEECRKVEGATSATSNVPSAEIAGGSFDATERETIDGKSTMRPSNAADGQSNLSMLKKRDLKAVSDEESSR